MHAYTVSLLSVRRRRARSSRQAGVESEGSKRIRRIKGKKGARQKFTAARAMGTHSSMARTMRSSQPRKRMSCVETSALGSAPGAARIGSRHGTAVKQQTRIPATGVIMQARRRCLWQLPTLPPALPLPTMLTPVVLLHLSQLVLILLLILHLPQQPRHLPAAPARLLWQLLGQVCQVMCL